MKEYENKKLGFKFYIDTWEEHTDEKLRIYDSNKDYCDYIEECSIIIENCDAWEYIKNLAYCLENADTIKEFMAEFSCDYEIEEYIGQERDDMTNVFGKWLIILH